MRVPLRLIAPVLLAAVGVTASTAPATAVDNPVGTVTCLTEAPTAVDDIAADPKGALDPDSLLDPATAPGVSCLAP
ncbi:hypothetical protein [Streptomyces sp. NPDC014676]|uniref:hypothetical protein n=1 Tax=Streptomyces sp. NPDC014676 TaxID=3364879 RepID=UPI0036FCD269